MAAGKGTYGSQVGRPPKDKKKAEKPLKLRREKSLGVVSSKTMKKAPKKAKVFKDSRFTTKEKRSIKKAGKKGEKIGARVGLAAGAVSMKKAVTYPFSVGGALAHVPLTVGGAHVGKKVAERRKKAKIEGKWYLGKHTFDKPKAKKKEKKFKVPPGMRPDVSIK